MDINHLKEFLVLAQTGNFLEAAELLFISQSALSKHIKRIEAEVGVPLFNRTTRKVALSRYGHLLLPYAQQIVLAQNEYTKTLLLQREQSENCLEIGSIPALAPYHITDVLVRFKRDRQHTDLHISQAGTAELIGMLRDGQCELAFLRETSPEQEDDLQRIPFATDSLVAVLPQTHPLAGQKQLSLLDLKDEEFLLIEKNSMLYDLSYNACLQSGFEPHIGFTDHQLGHLIDFVQKGLGIALLMQKLALHQAAQEVSIVSLSPTVRTWINLCYRKNARLSSAAKHFLHCANQQRCAQKTGRHSC